ncbi:10454_t:CDS:2 [Entrophospora sp. SA101]|nr:10454_t:CDS:2 [Entrophospora sp. SA101]
MKILAIGDIFGKTGRRVIERNLFRLKKEHEIDLVIANVENTTHGKGISRKHYQELKNYGIDIMTSGNHIFAIEDTRKYINEVSDLLRPINSNPYHPDIHLVDYHAETTAEKIALTLYFDGKISALWGTHTHVQTADERILSRGTGFITDLGMTGPYGGVIGAKPEVIFQRAKYGLPAKMTPTEDNGQFNGVVLEFDDNNKVVREKRTYTSVSGKKYSRRPSKGKVIRFEKDGKNYDIHDYKLIDLTKRQELEIDFRGSEGQIVGKKQNEVVLEFEKDSKKYQVLMKVDKIKKAGEKLSSSPKKKEQIIMAIPKIHKIRKLKKVYGSRTVLQNVSFAVKKGSIHGFIGPNGAGKTTTLNCLMSGVKPNAQFAEDLRVEDFVHLAGQLRNIPSQKVEKRLRQSDLNNHRLKKCGELSTG